MPVVAVLLAAVLFGTTGTARALGLPDADPLAVGALRLAVGGSLLGAIALLGGRRAGGPRMSVGAAALILVAAAGVCAYQPAFFAGVGANGVAVGTLVALGSAPVFTGLVDWLARGRRPGARWLGCTALAVAGVLLLSGLVDGGAARSVSAAGIAGSLGAGAAYAVYTLAVKGLLDAGWPVLRATGAVFGTAGLVGLAEAGATAGAVPLEPRALVAVAWLGAGTIAVAYLLFARGLERLPAATVSTLTLAEPVVAGVLGVVVLAERITPAGWIGTALLVAALVLLASPRRTPRGAVPPEAAGA